MSADRTPPDAASRARIVSELDRCVLVEAAAGTGKTTSMIARMIALLGQGRCGDVGSMAAVTFTRKAAAELRARFRLGLEKAARESRGPEQARLAAALAGIDRCFIGTIHSFCGRLLRERPVEAGIDVSFTELDEVEDGRLRAEAWRNYIAAGGGAMGAELDRLGIRPAELAAAFSKFADYPDVQEWPAEAAERPDLGGTLKRVQAYVDHMLEAAKALPRECGNDSLIPRYRIIPRVASDYGPCEQVSEQADLLERFKGRAKVVQKIWAASGASGKDDAKAEQARWDRFQEEVALPALTRLQEHRYPFVLAALAEARREYDRLRAGQGGLNYQDLLLKAAALLREHAPVRRYFQARFTHLLVDEFQDTDPIQAEVMLLLTAGDAEEKDWRKCRPRPGSLFVVGDPKQSIYRFRRADIVTYNEVKRIIAGPGAEGLALTLSANFRATPAIIDWVNAAFGPADGGATDGPMLRFPAAASAQSPAYVPLTAGRTDAEAGELAGVYRLTAPAESGKKDDAVEADAAAIAAFIRSAVDAGLTVPRSERELASGKSGRVGYDDFLIITRNTTHLGRYAGKLEEQGIPHRVTGGSSLNEVAELRWLHAALLAAMRPDDAVALVGALRSELFGVSDAALYRFKKAGGQFSFRAPVPAGLDADTAAAMGDAFARLAKYERWLALLPAATAVERVIADAGLAVSAALRPGGDVRAGSLGKAVELLRAAPGGAWSATELVDYLGRLVEQDEKYDGVSVRSAEPPVVRVMNLHQVKGLEAPVVLLADPSGESRHEVDLHLDREGDRVRGFLPIVHRPEGSHAGRVIALPPGWKEAEASEAAFRRAEDLRLRYVAATRAGAALIVTQKAAKNSGNPWQYFSELIPPERELPRPGPAPAPAVRAAELDPAEAERWGRELAARLAACGRVTEDVRSAREFARAEAGVTAEAAGEAQGSAGAAAEGEHGQEWGSVIHALLREAMREPGAELAPLARALLADKDLPEDLVEPALATVRAVAGSELWQRASRSALRLTEAPFLVRLADAAGAVVTVRGAVDLAFREDGGWVIVDYKTDVYTGPVPPERLAAYGAQVRVYGRAWAEAAGEAVKELLVWFVRSGELFIIT